MLLGLSEVRLWLQILAIASLLLAAWRIGGGPERALGGVLAGMMAIDLVYHGVFEGLSFAPPEWTFHFALDLTALAATVPVALLANRMYPLWFAAFQLIAVFAHLARDLAPGVAKLAYGIMYIGPSYFQILLLAGGIWLHHRRVRKYGPYRSWRNFSRPSPARMPDRWPNG
jgi:hypothetical protein